MPTMTHPYEITSDTFFCKHCEHAVKLISCCEGILDLIDREPYKEVHLMKGGATILYQACRSVKEEMNKIESVRGCSKCDDIIEPFYAICNKLEGLRRVISRMRVPSLKKSFEDIRGYINEFKKKNCMDFE